MDDEIEIEEHDILEHPQVKAAFPDLSKIQIQAHTTGVSLFEEAATYTEEYVSLLEERGDYVDSDNEEINEKSTQYNDLPTSTNIDEEELEDRNSDKEEASEALLISDSESNEETPTNPEENVDIKEEISDNVTKTAENKLVDIQEISDDEVKDATPNSAKLISKIKDIAEFTEKVSNITNSDKTCNEVTVPARIQVENIHEISDDDELDGLAEEVDKIDKEATENGVELVEKAENGDELIEKAPENDKIFEEDPANSEIIEEGPGNDEVFEEDPENDKILEEGPRNDEIIEEGPGLTEDCEMNDNNEVPERIGQTEVENVDPKEGEYLHVPIKEEIDFIPIKEELDDDYEDYNLEENSPETFNNELPPEDIYHFNNKIILGSKPSPKVNNLNTYPCLVVLLEDWGEHLRQSQSFCQDCEILFTTPNALDVHRMTAHSLLAPITNRALKSTAKTSLGIAKKSTTENKNIARKSTGTIGQKQLSNSTYCNHCNFTFKDHTDLIKHLYELLPAKKFSCNTCNETFKNQNDLVIHNKVHIKIEPRKILKAKKDEKNPLLRNLLAKEVAVPKLVKQNRTQIKKEPSDSIDKVRSKFKCTLCSDIFDHYSAARRHRLLHPESCSNGKRSVILKRLVPKVNRNISPSKVKLKYEEDCEYKTKKVNRATNFYDELVEASRNKNRPFDLMPKSALFQCPKCSLHFTSPVGGTTHMTKQKCCAIGVWSCPTCKKKIRKIDESCHKKQHELSTKIKIYKISKTCNQRTLCKCSKCGVYFNYILLKMHINKCGKIPTAKCQKCNILLPKPKLLEHCLKHETLNLKPKDFILVDFAAINDKTNTTPVVKTKSKPVKIKSEPGISVKTEPGTVTKSKIRSKLTFEKDKVKIYYCKHCKSSSTSCNRELTRRTHLAGKCVVKYKYRCYNCELCGLQIPNMHRSVHNTLHAERNITLNDLEFYEFTSLGRIIPTIPRYPSCGKCNIHFLDRDMKKNHICGEDYDNCEFCGEKFELAALNVHRPFHKLQTRKTKTIEQPKIMPELMEKYESLNAIWNILFICGNCELVTDLYNKAVEHSQSHLNKEPTQPNTIKCYICNLKFDESCWSKHSELHSRMKINKKDFKVLSYSPLHLLDESWFQMFDSLPEKEIRQIIDRSVFGTERSLKMNLVKDGLPEFTVYCCSNCRVAYDNNNILGHVKSKCKTSAHICETCDIAFNDAHSLDFHKELHKKGIKKDEFRIVHFVKTPNSMVENDAKRIPKVVVAKKAVKRKRTGHYVLYKCVECSVCVLRKMSKSNHICAPEHHKVFCKICKQNFSFRQTNAHKEKHRSIPDFRAKNTKIINFKPIPGNNKPSKNKRKSLKNNNLSSAPTENKNDSKSETSDTDLSVSPEIELTSASNTNKPATAKRKSVQSDLSEQPKSKERKTLNSSKHRTSRVISLESDNEDKKLAKVFKCDCGLHYTSLQSIEKHIETCNDTDEISKENCSKCGLVFPTDVLVSHLCKHHSQDTKITVEEIHKKVVQATSTKRVGSKTSPDKNHIKLYKCSDCNVYFMNQNTCFKHVVKHEMLDPRQYIECKICSLQFGLRSLVNHMTKHHDKQFDLENVLVEEYHPRVGRDAPKIDIYFANEKVQNVQVSSTND